MAKMHIVKQSQHSSNASLRPNIVSALALYHVERGDVDRNRIGIAGLSFGDCDVRDANACAEFGQSFQNIISPIFQSICTLKPRMGGTSNVPSTTIAWLL